MDLINHKKQKIAFLLFSLEAGGAERVASIMANHLTKNTEVHLILFNAPINYTLPKGIKLKTLRDVYSQRWKRLLTLPLVLFRLSQYLKQQNINILLSFDTLPNIVACCLAYFRKNLTIWLRVSNHCSTQFSSNNFKDRYLRFLIKKLYPQANKIYVNSNRIKADLIQNHQIKVPIQLLLNPIDLSPANKKTAFATNKKFIFVNVSGFRIQKNHILLIEAFEKIKNLNVELWLIGKGNEQERVREKVETLGLSQHVLFLGYQSNPFQYMKTANCMVLSSDFEGLPNVLIEGLACGLPIISTDCPSGPREIIAPNTDYKKQVKNKIEVVEYGILTPVGNANYLAEAMTKVYYDKAFQQSEKYTKRANDFDVNVVLKDFGNLL